MTPRARHGRPIEAAAMPVAGASCAVVASACAGLSGFAMGLLIRGDLILAAAAICIAGLAGSIGWWGRGLS